ncbi:hypothetical protein Tco_1029694 [Tanacetum coccineum]|uniref:Uncharacterized protein n=1 Tax=Tanacetum coccineum TaxID=301880 RepID=A0ABQ5G458_9ASTR
MRLCGVVDLTQDYTKTPSPKLQISSPSAPNAPSKTLSTKDTSSSSIYYISKSLTSSTLISPNGYLNLSTSPLRVSPPPPTQENASMDITLTLVPRRHMVTHAIVVSTSKKRAGRASGVGEDVVAKERHLSRRESLEWMGPRARWQHTIERGCGAM